MSWIFKSFILLAVPTDAAFPISVARTATRAAAAAVPTDGRPRPLTGLGATYPVTTFIPGNRLPGISPRSVPVTIASTAQPQALAQAHFTINPRGFHPVGFPMYPMGPVRTNGPLYPFSLNGLPIGLSSTSSGAQEGVSPRTADKEGEIAAGTPQNLEMRTHTDPDTPPIPTRTPPARLEDLETKMRESGGSDQSEIESLAEAEDVVAQINAAITDLADLEDARERMPELEAELDTTLAELEEVSALLRQTEADAIAAATSAAEAARVSSATLQAMRQEVARLKAENGSVTAQLESERSRARADKQRVSELSLELDAKKLQVADLEQDREQIRKTLAHQTQQIHRGAVLFNPAVALVTGSQSSKLNAADAARREQIGSFEGQLEEHGDVIDCLEDFATRIAEANRALATAKAAAAAEIEKLEGELDAAPPACANCEENQRRAAEAESRVEVLERQLEERESESTTSSTSAEQALRDQLVAEKAKSEAAERELGTVQTRSQKLAAQLLVAERQLNQAVAKLAVPEPRFEELPSVTTVPVANGSTVGQADAPEKTVKVEKPVSAKSVEPPSKTKVVLSWVAGSLVLVAVAAVAVWRVFA